LLAHNEDNALRCIFHGWKYDVSGKVVECPTEPRNPEAFCKTVPLKHYPVREAAGVVFVWLGKGAPQKFQNFEFTNLPSDQCYVTSQIVNCNWVQEVEGGMDSAHVGILHQSWMGNAGVSSLSTSDNSPVLEFEDCPSGYRYAAIRKLKNGSKYIRVNEFVAPWYCFICPAELPDGDRLVLMINPIDDYHTIHWNFRYNASKPLKPSIQNPAAKPDDFPPATIGGRTNRWGQDRGAMMRGHFTGFPHLNTEDFATAESMGPIADRSQEFLSSSDLAIVRLRRVLLNLVKESVAKGGAPVLNHQDIAYDAIRARGYITDNPSIWKLQVA
jgi:phenylpropionate dioxygenase-like ring-hydroxylating dioxygenase large terminal subunit